MKSPTGYAKPRRPAASRKPVRLDLRRAGRGGDDEPRTRRKNPFWKWVTIVALFHLAALAIVAFLYRSAPPPAPEPFISLLPQGETTHGTPGQQGAPKLNPATTAAPSSSHSAAPAHPKIVPPPKPLPTVSTKPQDLVEKPVPAPPKPTPPKVKVDLTLANAPDADVPAKPKPHVKKVVDPTDADADSESKSSGLSREQVAAKLGEKLDAEGVKNSLKTGISGSPHSQASPFADFYASIRDQVMSKWTSPNLTDESAVNPIVQIHIDKDGHVPPDQVKLIQSSGNSAYDDSALAAARGLGYLLQPLPDGCPPDTQVTFKLTR